MTGSTRGQLVPSGQEVDYRASHAAPGYAATYAKTYETGFGVDLTRWRRSCPRGVRISPR